VLFIKRIENNLEPFQKSLVLPLQSLQGQIVFKGEVKIFLLAAQHCLKALYPIFQFW
jgi:hypothetical protein